MMFSRLKFALALLGLAQLLKFTAWRYPAFRARLKQRNLVAQIKARDEGTGRWIELRDGKISSGAGLHRQPDVTLAFKNAATGASLLTPPINWLSQINAQKDFTLGVDGPEDLTNWAGLDDGQGGLVAARFDGQQAKARRCLSNMTNGGP